MKENNFKIEHVKRKVFRTSFLKNVSYAITLKDVVVDDKKLKDFADGLVSDGFMIHELTDYERGVVIARKKGILLTCFHELFLLNVQIGEYGDYEHFKKTILAYLHRYSDIVSAKMVRVIYIMKMNEFSLNRSNPEMENVSKEQFEQVVYSKEFLDCAVNGEVKEKYDDAIVGFAKNTTTEKENSYLLELMITALRNKECKLNQVDSYLDQLNGVAYDIWHAVLSETMKKSMNENESK